MPYKRDPVELAEERIALQRALDEFVAVKSNSASTFEEVQRVERRMTDLRLTVSEATWKQVMDA